MSQYIIVMKSVSESYIIVMESVSESVYSSDGVSE